MGRPARVPRNTAAVGPQPHARGLAQGRFIEMTFLYDFKAYGAHMERNVRGAGERFRLNRQRPGL